MRVFLFRQVYHMTLIVFRLDSLITAHLSVH